MKTSRLWIFLEWDMLRFCWDCGFFAQWLQTHPDVMDQHFI